MAWLRPGRRRSSSWTTNWLRQMSFATSDVMTFQDTFETYLLDTMVKLCPCAGSEIVPDSEMARSIIEESRVFPPHSRVENLKRTFMTEGVVGPAVYGDQFADFHQGSSEHRFQLARWPAF